MRKIAISIIILMCLVACAGTSKQDDQVNFAVETMAMAIGYELTDFQWSDDAQKTYDIVMAGQVTVDVAQVVQKHFADNFHPVILNRMFVLAEMIGGFEFKDGVVIGIDSVDMELLKVAVNGLKTGVMLRK